MARQERNNVDYFPHTVTHGKKMFYLREKYGNDAYAVWFMLLEELGKADYHFLNLSDDIDLMYLSSTMKVSENLLLEIIESLVKFKEFDALLWQEKRVLFNQGFVDSISDAYKKRNNSVISLSTLYASLGIRKLDKSNPNEGFPPLKVSGGTQRIGKDRIGKDRIGEKREKSPSFFSENTEELEEPKTQTEKLFDIAKKQFYEGEDFQEAEEVFPTGVAEDLETKRELIENVLNWFNMSESFYHKERSALLNFLNLLHHNEQFDHFKIQWGNYKAYKEASGTQKHSLFGFIGQQKENFEDAKWNNSNWGAMLEGLKKNTNTPVKNKKQTITEAIEQMKSLENPFDPDAPAPN